MKKSLVRGIIVTIVMLAILSMFSLSFANNKEVERSIGGKAFHKLGRGLTNILTGWIEIPKNIADTWEETDPFTGMVVGTIKGIAFGWTRTAVGVYDVVTFPFPAPSDYQPVMRPEFILPEIWGDSFPGLPDENYD